MWTLEVVMIKVNNFTKGNANRCPEAPVKNTKKESYIVVIALKIM